MSALTREELIEACAAIYAAAHENFMLPPLIHGADDAEASSRSSYQCLGGDIRVEFAVSFDAEHVRRSGFPLERLPLRFKAQLSDREGRDLPIQLGEMEMAALTYAFLLGVKAPISVELEDDAPEGKCAIQLAPAFFVEWRQPFEADEHATSEQVCRAVGRSLCRKSRDLFLTEADGVSIWSLRAAQELLGEPKPSADELWARFSPTALLTGATASGAVMRIEPPTPAAALAPIGALRRFRATQLGYAAAAALALMTACGASLFYAVPQDSAAPRLVASVATPAAPQDEEAREPVFEPIKTASFDAPVVEQAEPSTPAAEPREAEAGPARITVAEVGVAEAAAAASSAALVAPTPKAGPSHKSQTVKPTAVNAAAAKSVPPGGPAPGQAASGPNNPLIVVGRALQRFTSDVARGLHRLTTL